MDTGKKCSVVALIPFVVFVVFYVGLSVWARDFYKVPMIAAFLVASAVALALDWRSKLSRRIDVYASGMGEQNIMIMCLIFILSGAFATIAKSSGAVLSAVTIARSVMPDSLIVTGLFLVSCFVSIAVGTSCGTIAAITPIAVGLVQSMGCPAALAVGAVVGGAMFGDNLSMISDTTIAATRTQGIEMRDKFLANLWIAVPAALATIVVYLISGFFGAGGGTAAAATAPAWKDALLVTPYVLILVLALCGMNVMFLLLSGALLAAFIGICCGCFDFWGALDCFGKGALGMSETLIVALLAGGLLTTIRSQGGIEWLTRTLSRMIRGPRSCEAGMAAMTFLVDLFTANNTVALVITGPIARDFSKRFNCSPARIASVIDTSSCIAQGLIPYGAQLLIAVSLAKESGVEMSSLSLLAALPYQAFLAIAVVVAICRSRNKA